MNYKAGDKVRVIDGSWSYSFSDTGAKAECGLSLKGEFEVIQAGLKMPIRQRVSGNCHSTYYDVPDNDTLIKEISTGKIVSIQEGFLRKIEPVESAPKFQVGDKVVPHSKSYGDSFEAWKNDVKPAPYYVVDRVWNNGDVGIANGVFKSYDLTFYIEHINHCPENKTFKVDDTLFIFNGPATVCIIEIDGELFKGVAKCSPAEKWDDETGMAWAELRARRAMLDEAEECLRRA